MAHYLYKSISPVSLVIIVTAALLISACDEKMTITEYSLQKVDPKSSHGHEWLPLNPTTYRIGNNSVTSETVGYLDKYDNCKTMSVKNWECKYNDGSVEFGVRNRKFWRQPE